MKEVDLSSSRGITDAKSCRLLRVNGVLVGLSWRREGEYRLKGEGKGEILWLRVWKGEWRWGYQVGCLVPSFGYRLLLLCMQERESKSELSSFPYILKKSNTHFLINICLFMFPKIWISGKKKFIFWGWMFCIHLGIQNLPNRKKVTCKIKIGWQGQLVEQGE